MNTQTTADQLDAEKFSTLHSDWWHEDGIFKALHSMNRVRIPWISDTLSVENGKMSSSCKPLSGKRILDVGSGGGILSVPLARLGARVIGLETVAESAKAATNHLEVSNKIKGENLDIDYVNSSIEDYVAENAEAKFDALVASEVVEHVSDRKFFIENCSKLLPSGSHLFLTTLNKTLASKILAVYMAENILGIVPPGIHDWEKFVSPENLELQLEKSGFRTKMIHGLCYNPLNNKWSWIRNTSINYAICAVKV
uniref:Ubiquinone biosynthesis O-methyltransferase, mitochondrial n=1 Tax=Romanomermis culicivorax TaxID=13658 RepID=A0A915JYW7_ROMCU